MFTEKDLETLFEPKVIHRAGGQVAIASTCDICTNKVRGGDEFHFIYISKVKKYLGLCTDCHINIYS